jgi:2-amino-4-hydroxy-6-hydroxymethyldihydropteridine diphosphokinase
MKNIFVALGSNLAEPVMQLRKGLHHLAKLPLSKIEKVSRFYRNPPIGFKDQPEFVNAVAKLSTNLSAHELMDALEKIEEQQGRTRTTLNGPRTLDLDLLLYGTETITTARLMVPHPRMRERAFVIYPLFEIEPTLCLPCGTAITSLLLTLPLDTLNVIERDEEVFANPYG